MDTNSAPQLDPKLKETYNKIMGFNLDNTSIKTTTTPIATNEQNTNVDTINLATPDTNLNSAPLTISTTPSPSQKAFPILPENQIPLQPLNAIPNNILEIKPETNNAPTAPSENKEAKPEKLIENKNNPEIHGFIAHNNDVKKIPPIIIILAAAILIIAYALFWIKLLNLHIPALGI